MTATIFVVPAPVAEGEPPRVVRHPARGWAVLPPEGAEWPREDVYTAARLRDGDVVEATAPAIGENPGEQLGPGFHPEGATPLPVPQTDPAPAARERNPLPGKARRNRF